MMSEQQKNKSYWLYAAITYLFISIISVVGAIEIYDNLDWDGVDWSQSDAVMRPMSPTYGFQGYSVPSSIIILILWFTILYGGIGTLLQAAYDHTDLSKKYVFFSRSITLLNFFIVTLFYLFGVPFFGGMASRIMNHSDITMTLTLFHFGGFLVCLMILGTVEIMIEFLFREIKEVFLKNKK